MFDLAVDGLPNVDWYVWLIRSETACHIGTCCESGVPLNDDCLHHRV